MKVQVSLDNLESDNLESFLLGVKNGGVMLVSPLIW